MTRLINDDVICAPIRAIIATSKLVDALEKVPNATHISAWFHDVALHTPERRVQITFFNGLTSCSELYFMRGIVFPTSPELEPGPEGGIKPRITIEISGETLASLREAAAWFAQQQVDALAIEISESGQITTLDTIAFRDLGLKTWKNWR